MVQKTDVFGHVLGDRKSTQILCTWYDVDRFAAASRPQTYHNRTGRFICVIFPFSKKIENLYFTKISTLTLSMLEILGIRVIISIQPIPKPFCRRWSSGTARPILISKGHLVAQLGVFEGYWGLGPDFDAEIAFD